MSVITAGAVIDKAVIVLQDATNIRWVASELLGWFNDGQREVVLAKPDACTQTKSVALVAGTKQALGGTGTTDAILFLKPVRNMGLTPGTTAGRAIRMVAGEILDAQRPDWHSETADAAVKHVVYDPRVPLTYYVYPPNTGTGYIEISYSAVPTAAANTAATLSVSDVFANALIDYILYRAYSKDAEYAANKERAVAHYQAFLNGLGLNSQQLLATNPNMAQQQFNPNVPGAAQ